MRLLENQLNYRPFRRVDGEVREADYLLLEFESGKDGRLTFRRRRQFPVPIISIDSDGFTLDAK